MLPIIFTIIKISIQRLQYSYLLSNMPLTTGSIVLLNYGQQERFPRPFQVLRDHRKDRGANYHDKDVSNSRYASLENPVRGSDEDFSGR